MSVIKAMIPIAKKMAMLDRERRKLESRMQLIQQREERLAEGDTRLEVAIDEINALYMKSNTAEEFEEKMNELNLDPDLRRIARAVVER